MGRQKKNKPHITDEQHAELAKKISAINVELFDLLSYIECQDEDILSSKQRRAFVAAWRAVGDIRSVMTGEFGDVGSAKSQEKVRLMKLWRDSAPHRRFRIAIIDTKEQS
jgi:hypothetical protein